MHYSVLIPYVRLLEKVLMRQAPRIFPLHWHTRSALRIHSHEARAQSHEARTHSHDARGGTVMKHEHTSHEARAHPELFAHAVGDAHVHQRDVGVEPTGKLRYPALCLFLEQEHTVMKQE